VALLNRSDSWPHAVGELDASTPWFDVGTTLLPERLNRVGCTPARRQRRALEPGPPSREPGFPFAGRVAITSQPSIQELHQFLSDNGDRLTPAFSEGGFIFLD
jgi:hypothetical protein